MSATTFRARRILHRIATSWSDMQYADRRLFELRTGTRASAKEHATGNHPATR